MTFDPELYRVVLYAGTEVPFPDELQEEVGYSVVVRPRELSLQVEKATKDHRSLIVVPAGTGRDLTSVTQAAQALQWAQRFDHKVALAPSLIDATRTIAELRRHLRAAVKSHDSVLFVAQTVDPFADAELVRRIRLARQFSEQLLVETTFEGSWPEPERAKERLRLLGAENPAVIRADLGVESGAVQLFRKGALVTAVEEATKTAVHRLRDNGDNGVAAGLLADHEQGFAHSHGDEDHSHGHSHSHSHGHSHGHTHSH